MTTSGTIGLTKISTARLLEKAIRRCGVNPATQTPETVSNAQESMFMFLLSLSNRGLNLWTIDKQLLSLAPNQATYTLPIGTQDLLNVMLSTPALVTDYLTINPLPSLFSVTFIEPFQKVVRFGIRFTDIATKITMVSLSETLEILQTRVFQLQNKVPMVPGELYWFDLDPAFVGKGISFELETENFLSLSIVDTLYLCQDGSEIAVTAFNRDDYTNQPRKTFTSTTITNYWFEKLVNPRVTFWPVPSDETKCIELWRYRQIQDVGEISEELEIPARWYEAITWHLALRLAFELPGVEVGRIQAIQQMTQQMTMEVEGGETDGSPTYFAPDIGVYTR